MLFIAFLLISANAVDLSLSTEVDQGRDYLAEAEFLFLKAIFGEDAGMIINKLRTCNQDIAPDVYKQAKMDYLVDLGPMQHVCYRTNNYELQRKVWVNFHDHFQQLFKICDLDMEGTFMQKEYDILIGTTDRLNTYLRKAHAAYVKYTENFDHAIFGTPADAYWVNDSPELRELDKTEDHLYGVIGAWLQKVQNGLQDRKRRFNANLSKTTA